MYLLPSSCHSPHQHENIPFGLAMRIISICSFSETRDLKLSELKEMFLQRHYPPNIIYNAISKARNIPRTVARKKVVKSVLSKRPIAVVSWDPWLSLIDTIQQKHWHVMTLDPYLKGVFPEAPLVAYRRQTNLRKRLICAKWPPQNETRNQRHLKGLKVF